MGKASHFTQKNLRQMDINRLIINNNLTPKAASRAVNELHRKRRDLLNSMRMRDVRMREEQRKHGYD